MVQMMKARKKTKKVFSKRSQSGYAAAPTENFWKFKDFARTEIDKKETAKIIREYVKKTFPIKERKIMLDAPEWVFAAAYHVGATIQWMNLGLELPENWNKDALFERYFDEVMRVGLRNEKTEEEEAAPVAPSRSPAEIVKERTSDFIAEVEAVLDIFFEGIYGKNVYFDIENYSPFLELKKIDAPYNTAKALYDYYVPLRNEIQMLVEKKPKDMEEGYKHLNAQKRKDYLQLLNNIVSDAEKYMQSKKAVRATRIAKPKTADKQIKDIKYLQESMEFKLTSISPIKVVGAMRLYTFNVKSRTLTEYVCRQTSGFEIKGTSLTNIDEELSREVKLRKPEEFLPIVMKQNPTKIAEAWKNLTTKTGKPNSRINIDTLLLRALER